MGRYMPLTRCTIHKLEISGTKLLQILSSNDVPVLGHGRRSVCQKHCNGIVDLTERTIQRVGYLRQVNELARATIHRLRLTPSKSVDDGAFVCLGH